MGEEAATMHDEERLALLKEIGGTSVYEDKKRESLKVMDDNKSCRDQIQEIAEFIEQRLGELDAEKDANSKSTWSTTEPSAPSSTPSTRRTSAKRAPSWTRSRSAALVRRTRQGGGRLLAHRAHDEISSRRARV